MMILTDKKPRVNVEAILTSEEIQGIEQQIEHYPDPRAASLDALKLVQKRNGWVDDAQIVAVGQMLGLPASDVEGVATFYNRIYRRPVGRNVILLCDSIACFLMGAETLAEAFKQQLGIEYGQTTLDDRFTLLPICCLGNCDKSPTLMINEDTHDLVSINDISELLERYV